MAPVGVGSEVELEELATTLVDEREVLEVAEVDETGVAVGEPTAGIVAVILSKSK